MLKGNNIVTKLRGLTNSDLGKFYELSDFNQSLGNTNLSYIIEDISVRLG